MPGRGRNYLDRMLGRNEGSESRDFTDGKRYGEEQRFYDDEEFRDSEFSNRDREFQSRGHRTQASRNVPRTEQETRYRRQNPRNFDYSIDDGDNVAFRDSEMSRGFKRNDSFATGDFRRGFETQRSGGFFGKGPKGYKRSDDRVKEEVSEALYRDYHIDASEIEVDVKDGVVTLSGTVDSRASKRSAEECIENLSGVVDVHNRIRIADNANVSNLRSGGDREEKRSLS